VEPIPEEEEKNQNKDEKIDETLNDDLENQNEDGEINRNEDEEIDELVKKINETLKRSMKILPHF